MLDERPTRTEPARTGAAQEVVIRVDQPRSGRRVGMGSVVVLTVAVLTALVAAGALLLWSGGFGLDGLFGTQTVDRSAPVLVERLRNRNEFRGATGTFAVTVDLETKHSFIPTFLAGSRTIYSGVGDVDATISLRHIAAATTDPDGTLVLTLPHAELGAAHLDPHSSHVMSRDRGLADRIGGTFSDSPTSDRGVERVAVRRIERAAARRRRGRQGPDKTAPMVRGVAPAGGVERHDQGVAETLCTKR
jgi:hypothetical protein